MVIKKSKRMSLDRIQGIFKMHENGVRNRKIAWWHKCSAGTVSDTLNKYRHPDELIWNGMCCYEKAKYVWDILKARAKAKKRFRGQICDVEVRRYVRWGLIIKEWSPEIISNKIMKAIGKKVSTNTIYRYIKKSCRGLKIHLYEKGKPRKQRVAHRRGRFRQHEQVRKKYIDERPAIINSRKRFGDWEGDLIKGRKNGSLCVILSLIERKTRFKRFIKMPNAKTETTLAYLRAFFLSLPAGARKSITFDNGTEFSVLSMHKLEKLFPGFIVYFTDTYAPQQKGSDEHSNGRFRRPFPKKTDFAFVSQKEIDIENQKLNDRPMKLHGYETPQCMFDQEMELETQKLAMVA